MKLNIKAVAFDIDGTLYPNSTMYRHSLPLFILNLPLIMAMGKVRKIMRNDPPPTPAEFHKVQARLLAKELHTTPERAFALVEGRIYTRWFADFRRMSLFKGLTEVLQLIQDRGLKLACMSDFPIRQRLNDLGLGHYQWDSSFTSEDTGFLKPNPQPFQRICQDLQLPPENILYVGNSYTYDVVGATAAGMPVAHLGRHRPGSPAVLTFRKYRELKDFLIKILADSTKNP